MYFSHNTANFEAIFMKIDLCLFLDKKIFLEVPLIKRRGIQNVPTNLITGFIDSHMITDINFNKQFWIPFKIRLLPPKSLSCLKKKFFRHYKNYMITRIMSLGIMMAHMILSQYLKETPFIKVYFCPYCLKYWFWVAKYQHFFCFCITIIVICLKF